MKALRSLAPEVAALIKGGATADEVFAALGRTFEGQAAEQANTAAGRFERLKIRLDELKEALGARLLPILEQKVLPVLEKFAAWAEANPDKIVAVAAAVGVLTAGIVALNLAMMANPWVFAIAGLVGLIVYLERTYGLVTKIVEALDKLRPSLGGDVRGIIEQQATASRMFQTGEGAPLGGGAFRGATQGNVITINVNGGDPRAVVDAIVRWSRQNGKLPPQIQTAQ